MSSDSSRKAGDAAVSGKNAAQSSKTNPSDTVDRTPPPGSPAASTTVTGSPAAASRTAATSPLWPAPITTTMAPGLPRCEYPRMQIRAAVLEEFGQPLKVQDVELAAPAAGEVLVKLVACGVCHTDLYTASGADPSGYAPTVLGHEGAGVVEAVGEGVTSLQPGDHVVTLFSPQCRECIHCKSPKTNLCLAIREQQNKGHLPDGTTRLSRNGDSIRHFMGTSTFAEATVMPEIALAKITPDAPLDRACLFACGLSTGLGAAMYTAKVEPGSTCVIFGAGMVGLGAVAGCRLQGAERIICVDLSDDRLELATGQGATEVWRADEHTSERILEE